MGLARRVAVEGRPHIQKIACKAHVLALVQKEILEQFAVSSLLVEFSATYHQKHPHEAKLPNVDTDTVTHTYTHTHTQ